MKPVWNSLLLALNLVIMPAGTSIVLAKPTAPVPVRQSLPPSATDTTRSPSTPKTTQNPTPSRSSAPSPEAIQKLENALRRSQAESSRQQKLIEADRLYLGGQFAAAEKIYREVKPPFPKEAEAKQLPKPIVDPAQLPPAGQVYWRETQAGSLQQNLQTKFTVPLQLLVEQYPEFIPGQLKMAQVLQQDNHPKEALNLLEQATTRYPAQPDLLKAKVAALANTKKWVEASIAARQFALLNPSQPQAPEFNQLADENMKIYRRHLRRKLRGRTIANIITGVLGYALTGSLWGPFSAVQTTTMLARGESSVGESAAKQARKHLQLVQDPVVVDYVNEIGQRLAKVAGRNDFKYEFYVVLDDDLNAFALPGGKVFVNAGAIAHTNSEAELAGLMAHELSHAVLSHGFELVTEGNLLGNVTQFVPLGGTLSDLFTLSYSRDMERQADILGTRLLASTGYAADGERNLMVTLKDQEKSSPPSWLSDHPLTNQRIRYLENLIQENGYNRYAYEGVERHDEIKARVEKLIADQKQRVNKKRQR